MGYGARTPNSPTTLRHKQVSVHSPLLLFFRERGLLRWWMQQIFTRTVPRVPSRRPGHAWMCEASVHCAESCRTSFTTLGVNVGGDMLCVELTPKVMNEVLQRSTQDTGRIYSRPFMLYCSGPPGLRQPSPLSLSIFFLTIVGTPRTPTTIYRRSSQKFHSASGRLADPTVDRLLL